MLSPSLALALISLLSHPAITAITLLQPSPFPPNHPILNITTTTTRPTGPRRLTNFYVQPPIAVTLSDYGAPLPGPVARTCLSHALAFALSAHGHTPLSPILDPDLAYSSGRVALSFHPSASVYWEEWKNALYLMWGFVGAAGSEAVDTTWEFSFKVEVQERGGFWRVVGMGSLVGF